MQYSTLTFAAFVSTALAQTVHVVTVGGADGSKIYEPNSISAAVGDMVQFQFNPKNHTVTQSNFANPCTPIQDVVPTTQGFFSGFMSVSSTDVERPTFTIEITDTKPIWVYCSQAKHCQAGMSMVINEVAGSANSLANYQLAAKNITNSNLIPLAITSVTSTNSSSSSNSTSVSTGSSSGSNTTVTTGSPPSTNGGSSSSGSSSSGSSSGSSSSSSSASTTTSAGTAQVTDSGAGVVGVGSVLSLAVMAVGLVMM